MDEEENVKNGEENTSGEEGISASSSNKAKNAFKNGVGKIKGTFKKLLEITPLSVKIAILAAILIIIVIFFGIFIFQKLFTDNDIVGTAMENLMSENIQIAKSEGQGYYYKINKDIIDKFITALNKAYEEGGDDIGIELTFNSEDYDNIYIRTSSGKSKKIKDITDDELEEIIEDIDDNDDDDDDETEEESSNGDEAYDESIFEEYFKTKDLESAKAYLVKMIRTEIAGSYPRIGTYQGEDETEDNQGNLRDLDGDYVAQGMIKIERSSINKEVIYNGKTKVEKGNHGLEYYVITPEVEKKNMPMIVYLHGDGCVTAARRRMRAYR